jgi:branched-chain amino acid transport system ATP-binding protein
MIKLDKRRDVLAMNLTYAEQRALEIGITIAGGASVILLDEPTAGMSQSETGALRRADPRGHGRQDAADGGARHGRGVRPGRQDRGAGVRRGHRLRHAEAVRANPRVQEAYLGSVLAEQQAAGGGP